MKFIVIFIVVSVLLLSVCSSFNNKPNKNTKVKSSKQQFKKGLKQAKKLESTAAVLFNTTIMYKNLKNTVDLHNPAFSNLTVSQKETLKKKFRRVHRKIKTHINKHIKKIKLKVRAMRALEKKIKKQLRHGKKIAKKAIYLKKAMKKGKKKSKRSRAQRKSMSNKKTTNSFITTKMTKNGIQTASNKPNSKSKPAGPAAKSPSKPAAKSPIKSKSKASKTKNKVSNSKAGKSKPSASSRIGKVNNGITAGKLANTCVKAFYDSIPPSICWKRGGDVGIIPTGCPAGYFRHLSLHKRL